MVTKHKQAQRMYQTLTYDTFRAAAITGIIIVSSDRKCGLVIYLFSNFFKENNDQRFVVYKLLNVKMCCFSWSHIIVNGILWGFGQFYDVNLSLWWKLSLFSHILLNKR